MQVRMQDGTIIDAPDNATKQQVMALYSQQKPKEAGDIPDEVGGLDYAKGLTRSLVEGQTFGFGDEVGLGAAALPASLVTGEKYGDVYGKMRETYNQQQAEFERQNPKTALAANVAGGLMTGVPGAKAFMQTSRALANPIKAASLMGTTVGGVSGAGFAPTMEDVPKYTLMGAGAGAILPPAMALAGKAASPVMGAFKNMFTLQSPQATAAKTVGQFAGQDQMPITQLAESMKKMGGQATLADVGGENIRGMARAAGQLQGAGKDTAKKMFESRQTGSFNRLMGSFKKLSGGDANYFTNMQKIISDNLKNSAPHYKAAEAQSVAVTDDLATLFARPSMKAAISKGSRKAADEGVITPKNIKAGDTIGFKSFDYAKRALDDKISVALRQGNKDDVRILVSLKNEMLDIADNQIPDYKMARSIYSEGAGNSNAMELGKRILKDDFDEMSFMIDKMGKSEKDSFINGALKVVRDKLMTGKGDKNAATKLSSQLVRERLRTMFPDDNSYKSFINQLDVEDDFAKTYQNIYGGSQTQPRQVGASELVAATKGGRAIEGQDAASYMVNAVKNVTGRDTIPQPVVDELQRVLFTPLKQLSSKDWKMLRKHNISQKQAEKIQGMIPGVGSMVAIEGAAGAMSK